MEKKLAIVMKSLTLTSLLVTFLLSPLATEALEKKRSRDILVDVVPEYAVCIYYISINCNKDGKNCKRYKHSKKLTYVEPPMLLKDVDVSEELRIEFIAYNPRWGCQEASTVNAYLTAPNDHLDKKMAMRCALSLNVRRNPQCTTRYY